MASQATLASTASSSTLASATHPPPPFTPSTTTTGDLASSSPPGAHPFSFPREYFFPPFFTRQPNGHTHHAQLTKWSALVLAYCAHHRIFKLSLSTGGPAGASADPATATADPAANLFFNPRIDRRLSPADAREVADFMKREGRAEYAGDGGGGGDVVWVYWRTPEEWAALVEGWVDETAQKGTVLTLYELTSGDATRGTEFHGLDRELLQKALGVLVKRGKAQIFGQEDSQGVKFF